MEMDENLIETQLHQVDKTEERTKDKLLYKIEILKEGRNLYRDEKINVASFLEIEKDKHRLTNTTLTEKLKLCEQQLKIEKDKTTELKEMFKTEKEYMHDNLIQLYREAFNYMTVALSNTSYPGVGNYTRYASARLGLLPLPNVEQLKPEYGPVINDVISFRYRISVPQCQQAANRSIFIAVISAADNFNKRSVIRQTWQNHLKDVNSTGLMSLVGFAFIIGLTESNATQIKIEEENKNYEDIIQIEMNDFYENLTLKGAGLLNWLYRNCAKVDFVLKVDDDVYVNVRNLARFLNFYNASNQSMFGTSPASVDCNRGRSTSFQTKLTNIE